MRSKLAARQRRKPALYGVGGVPSRVGERQSKWPRPLLKQTRPRANLKRVLHTKSTSPSPSTSRAQRRVCVLVAGPKGTTDKTPPRLSVKDALSCKPERSRRIGSGIPSPSRSTDSKATAGSCGDGPVCPAEKGGAPRAKKVHSKKARGTTPCLYHPAS